MLLPFKALFFVIVAFALLLFGPEHNDDMYHVVPPVLKTEINTTNDWKAYTGKVYSFSYPAGWKVEECLKNCADSSSMRVTKNNGDSYLQISNQTYETTPPVNQCSIEVNMRTYFWAGENIEYLHTKDDRTFQIVEGDYLNDSSTGPKTSYRLFGDIVDKNTCHQLFGGEIKKTGDVKKMLQTLVING